MSGEPVTVTDGLAVVVHKTLADAGRPDLFAGVVAVLAGAIAPSEAPHGAAPEMVGVGTVRALARLLGRYRGLDVLDPLLGALTPHLPAPPRPITRSAPAVSGTRAVRAALSTRETQVLAAVAEGRTNAEIGRLLFISEDTVKTHLRRLFHKLGARDRAHMVHLAHVGGILTDTTAAAS